MPLRKINAVNFTLPTLPLANDGNIMGHGHGMWSVMPSSRVNYCRSGTKPSVADPVWCEPVSRGSARLRPSFPTALRTA